MRYTERVIAWRHKSSGQTARREAFSLLELLISLMLVIVLATFMWSRGSGNYQEGQKKLCQDNLQKCYMALQIFATDHNGKLPEQSGAKTSEEVLTQLVPRYSADTTIFICPGSQDAPLPSGEPFGKHRISYAYFMGARLADGTSPLMSDRQVDTSAKTNGQLIFSATGKGPGSNHSKYGGNVLFADGHAESSPPNLAFSLAWTNGVVLLNPKP